MNKFIFIAVATTIVVPAFCGEDVYLGADDYCLYDNNVGSGKCYWCAGQSSTPPGNCKTGYAMCMDEPSEILSPGGYIVPEGGDGFYAYSCSVSGWTRVRTSSNCDYGEYFDTGAYTCVKCPSVINIFGVEVNGTTDFYNQRPDITACYLEPMSGLQDEKGEYDLVEPCYYVE